VVTAISDAGSVLGSRRALVSGFFHDFPHMHAESLANGLQSIEGDVLFPSFDGAVVGAVHADLIRIAFLTVALRFPLCSNGQPEANTAADFLLHVRARYRPSYLSSTVI
jgi:hypothetical protein